MEYNTETPLNRRFACCANFSFLEIIIKYLSRFSIFCITTTSLIFRQPCSMFFLSLRITDKRPFCLLNEWLLSALFLPPFCVQAPCLPPSTMQSSKHRPAQTAVCLSTSQVSDHKIREIEEPFFRGSTTGAMPFPRRHRSELSPSDLLYSAGKISASF